MTGWFNNKRTSRSHCLHASMSTKAFSRLSTKCGAGRHNDHDLADSKPCITLVPDDVLPNGHENEDDGETSSAEDMFERKYCATCAQLANGTVIMRSKAEVAYHMRGK